MIKKVIISGVLCVSNLVGFAQKQTNFSIIRNTTIKSYSDLTGLPLFIELEGKHNVTVGLFPKWMSENFIQDDKVSLSLLKTETDNIGKTHHRFRELYNGYVLENSLVITHGVSNLVESFNGDWYRDIKLSNKIALTEKKALQLALKKVNAEKYKWENKEEEAQKKIVLNDPNFTYQPIGNLVILPLIDKKTKQVSFQYAYKFDIYAEVPLYRAYLYVDAFSGKIIKEQNILCTIDAVGSANTKYSGAQAITTDNFSGSYRLRETGRGGGIQTFNSGNTTTHPSTDFTNATNNWTNTGFDQAATDAHFGAEKVYDYYYQTFNRNSIDNAGYPLVSYVHYSNNLVNAFWDGSTMSYGDGNGSSFQVMTALDICGHEITHGLVSNTAGLGSGEAGALNEAFADIFGTTIEAFARPLQHDWKMGADVMPSGNGIRNMSNPNLLGDPDTYQGVNWDPAGEVHTNAGPCIYWYYLLCNGGSGTNDNSQAYNITGITMANAAAIAYRALTTYMTPSTNYANCRVSAIQAATDLFGACSNEVRQTTNAWYAVGVGPQSSCASYTLDAGITNIIEPPVNVVYCGNVVNTKVVLTNFGSTAISSARILYQMDATPTQTLNWTGNLLSNTSTTISLTPYTLAAGPHTFTAWVALPNGGIDQSASNDSKLSSFSIGTNLPLPFMEDFEGATFPPANWNTSNTITTGTISISWNRVLNSTGIPVTPLSSACARINNFYGDGTSSQGELHGLILPGLDFATANANTKIYFDLAHQSYGAPYSDTLIVKISSNCGPWTTIYSKGDPSGLPTAGNSTTDFTPTSNNQWRRDSISLAAYAGASKVYIMFLSKNGSGNNLYLDNINIKSANSYSLDASISNIIEPINGNTYCTNVVTPKVVLSNVGQTSISSAKILYQMDATTTQTLNWTGSLAAATSTTITLNPYTLVAGAHTFTAWVALPNGSIDQVVSNDSKTCNFNIGLSMPLPFKEDFEPTTFPPTNWSLYSSATGTTPIVWSRVTNNTGIPVTPLTTACAQISNYYGNNLSQVGQLDGLISPALNFSTANANTKLYFDISHQTYDNTYLDSLKVLISVNCGNWITIYAKGDPLSLPTVVGTSTVSYSPANNTDWRRDSISLSSYVGSNTISFMFLSKTGLGNNLYLDNINVKSTNTVTGTPPVAALSIGSQKCAGLPINFTDNSSNSPNSWNWNFPGASPATSSAQNPTVTYPSAGLYTVTIIATNAVGASSPVTQTIIVGNLPLITANSSTICVSSTATLTANGASTYTWNTMANGASITVTPTVNTVYTVGGTSSFGCTSYISTNVVIATSPVITVNSGVICNGSSVILNASGVSSYSWSTNSNAASISVSPSTTTVYTVSGSLLGCLVNATKTTTVVVNQLPSVTILPITPMCLTSAPVNIYGSPTNGTLTGTGIMINSLFDPSVSGAGTFPINYSYTDLNGCSNFATQSVTVSACTGIIELTNSVISIYPNPAQEVFYVNFNNSLTDNTTIELYDAIGKLVLNQKANNGIETISLISLSKGIYSLRIVSQNSQLNRRIIKE